MPDPFAVKDCALIAIATGKKAWTCRELRDTLREIDGDSIYYHFWGGLMQPRFEEREFNNDFAGWAAHSLRDAPLAERLAMVDPTAYPDIDSLRQELVELVEERLDEDDSLQWARGLAPFGFIRSQIVVFDTGRRLDSPDDLTAAVPGFSVGSVFYHFIDARRRSPRHVDDLRFWLGEFGDTCQGTIDRLAAIDPFFQPLTELRLQIAAALEQERCP
ncbi:MAG: DUF5752 family protein [Pseudomonadota bacterium]